MRLSNVYQAAQFHHELTAKPEYIRHNLTVAWKLLLIADAARHNDRKLLSKPCVLYALLTWKQFGRLT